MKSAGLGANPIMHAGDIALFAEGIRRELGDLRAGLGDLRVAPPAVISI